MRQLAIGKDLAAKMNAVDCQSVISSSLIKALKPTTAPIT